MPPVLRIASILAITACALGLPGGTSASSSTVTVTLTAVGGYGAAPALSGLPPNDPDISYQASDGSDQSGNITGTLTCSTSASAASGPRTYPVSSCEGLSDPGYDIVYSGASSYQVLASSITVRPYRVTNVLRVPSSDAVDVGWGKSTCRKGLAFPPVVIVPFGREQVPTGHQISVKCKFIPHKVAVLVHDLCFWRDPAGYPHIWYTYLPNLGCGPTYRPVLTLKPSTVGFAVSRPKVYFSSVFLIQQRPAVVQQASWKKGIATIAVSDAGDQPYCGTPPHPLPHNIQAKCGFPITVKGITPKGYDGQFRVKSMGEGLLSFALKKYPGQYHGGGKLYIPSIHWVDIPPDVVKYSVGQALK